MHSIGDNEKIVYDFKDCRCVSVLCSAYTRVKKHDVPESIEPWSLIYGWLWPSECGWGNRINPLHEQDKVFPAEPSLQPLILYTSNLGYFVLT